MKTSTEVEDAFTDYYKGLLGSDVPGRDHVNSHLIRTGNVISLTQKEELCKTVTSAEIKGVMWSIGGEKAPGPDGYSSQFVKDNWEIVQDDVMAATHSFFNSRKLLKQVNSTIITLIPKCNPPEKVTDFRPIACYNTIL